MQLTRRRLLHIGGATAGLYGLGCSGVQADGGRIDLRWSDLVPDEDGVALEALRELGIVQHGQMSTPFDQETAGVVTERYNGREVRIPGSVVPLEFDGVGVKAALLVPYVGACIHVPPPPPNQLIFVTSETPYESAGLFEAVYVSGVFGTSATETQLAEVGYAIAADLIEPYSG